MSTTETAFANNGERAVHLALKQRVHEAGQQAPRALYEKFDEHNIAHFGGQLKPAAILLTLVAPRNLGDYTATDPHGLKSRIRIAPSAWRRGQLFAEDVLLHEMVHGWCEEILADGEGGYRGHGPKFAAKCNEIGKALGLPEVFVRSKNNKGKPLCNHWPHCVRPEGYYGTALSETAPPKPKKEKGAADDALMNIVFEAYVAMSSAADSLSEMDVVDQEIAGVVDAVMRKLEHATQRLRDDLHPFDPWGDRIIAWFNTQLRAGRRFTDPLSKIVSDALERGTLK